MSNKKNKPTISLVTKNKFRLTNCDPDICKMCEPPSSPGLNQSCKPTTIKCVPGSGPGYKNHHN